MRVGWLLLKSVDQGLIARFIEAVTAQDYQDEFVPDLTRKFNQIPEIADLYHPPVINGYIDIFFEDAAHWLIGALALNRTISPSTFDIDTVVDTIVCFLRENPVDVILN